MLFVNTLGKFQILSEREVVNDDNIRSTMMTKLLLFLIIHREQSLTIDEIATALWHEEEVENPAGALKNLMYRLRNLLKQYFGDTEFVLTSRGAYCWNPEVKVIVDIEQFDGLIEKAKLASDEISDMVNYYEGAIRIYQGDFMTKLTDMYWVTTLSTYYHSRYLSAVKDLAELYIKAEMYDELERICNEALNHDNSDEQIYYYLIYARMKKNKLKLAMESYEKACDILRREFGVARPEKLQQIYEELLKMNKAKEAENIERMQEDISEENPEGAFFCGYPIFREIYRLEARKNTRFGEDEYVLLLTMEAKEAIVGATEQIEQYRIKKAMEAFEATIKVALRIGDVAAKYSDSQFVILLPACNYECAMFVANRIISRFYSENSKYRNMKIGISAEPLAISSTIVQ